MPKCFSAWNAVLNKSVNMHFRHEKQMKHNGTRLMKILIFYSLIMPFSCATCMSTLGFCIIIFLFSGSLPSTTLYYKACTKHFPVLLCTTKLAQSTSQYYFVLQSLHEVLPSTTLYYKVCTNYFPALLCTTKLAQSTFQYYFVLRSLHKVLPSNTLYYKACTKSFPVLLCTTRHDFCETHFPKAQRFFRKPGRLCQMPVPPMFRWNRYPFSKGSRCSWRTDTHSKMWAPNFPESQITSLGKSFKLHTLW